MPIHIALLRGINVGGKNKLPMKELTTLFVAAGCADVRTYIQSGNVVFSADTALAPKIPQAVSSGIRDRFGYEIPVVLRTAEELGAILQRNPFLDRGAEGKALHVAFLSATPSQKAVAALDPKRSPPDEFAVLGREIYLYCPKGVARSKLTNAWFDSTLGMTSTVRNWNTVNKLSAMASNPHEARR